MLYNSPTSTFNFKKIFPGLCPGPPLNRGREEGAKGGEVAEFTLLAGPLVGSG